MDEEYKRQLEALKLYFEAYKHLATLSVTTPLLALVLFRDFFTISNTSALLTVLLFLFSLFVALFGMFWSLMHLRAPHLQIGASFDRIFWIAGALFFSLGVTLLVLELINVPLFE